MHFSLSWHKQVLSNGLTVLSYARPDAMTTQLSVGVRYGSNDDFQDKIGTAHFLEHMLVGGSQKRIGILHEIERSGGCSYFETSNEAIFSSLDVVPEKLVDASKVFSELFFGKEFEENKLELERKVILNEIADLSDDPQGQTEETLLKCLFKHHPVKNPILGSKNTVAQLTLTDVTEAYEKYFTPQNMILTLSGRFSKKDFSTVLKSYRTVEGGSRIARKIRNSNEGKPKRIALKRKSGLSQSYLSFGLRTSSIENADAPALDLINAILGMGESSRLFIELREKRGLTYDFDSINVSGSDYGYFRINCATKPRAIEQTRKIIRDQLQRIGASPVTKSEVEKGKNFILANICRSFDSSFQLPRLLTELEMCFGKESAVIDYIERLKSLSEKTVLEVSGKYFQDGHYSEAILLPKKSDSLIRD